METQQHWWTQERTRDQKVQWTAPFWGWKPRKSTGTLPGVRRTLTPPELVLADWRVSERDTPRKKVKFAGKFMQLKGYGEQVLSTETGFFFYKDFSKWPGRMEMVLLFTTMWPEGWQEQKPVFPLEAQDPGWGFSVCADLTARDYGEYKEATVIRIKRHLYFLNVLNSHFYDTVTQTPWKPGYEENRSFYRISSQSQRGADDGLLDPRTRSSHHFLTRPVKWHNHCLSGT